MDKDKQSFYSGIVAGLAVISTIALIGLLIYIFSGDRASCIFQANAATSGTSNKTAKQFEACLTSGKYDSVVKADEDLGIQLGVQGTPASFINGYLVSGALPFDAVKQVIDELLAGKVPADEFLKDDSGKIVKKDMPAITDADHVTGAKNGKITIVEFSDFQCPYCGRYKTTVDQVLKAYPNDVTLVFKQFPLTSIHPYAQPAAVASECANEQGKFWEMYDKLFTLNISSTLSTDTISKAAVELGLK